MPIVGQPIKRTTPPVPPGKEGKLIIHYAMWRGEGAIPKPTTPMAFKARHQGKVIEFDRLYKAREFAERNGYLGIWVTSEPL